MTAEQKARQSEIMTVYNKARAAARKGLLDEGRVNRALGLLMSGTNGNRPYNTTTKTCDCPDHIKTGKACKHMIKMMMQVRISQAKA
jgi:vancomycin permeability regulator SanA